MYQIKIQEMNYLTDPALNYPITATIRSVPRQQAACGTRVLRPHFFKGCEQARLFAFEKTSYSRERCAQYLCL